jgi:histone H3
MVASTEADESVQVSKAGALADVPPKKKAPAPVKKVAEVVAAKKKAPAPAPAPVAKKATAEEAPPKKKVVAVAAPKAAASKTRAKPDAQVAQKKKKEKTIKKRTYADETQTEKKKKHRYRPGTVAAREVKKQQKSTGALIRRVPCSKLIRAVAAKHDEKVRFQQEAVRMIQDSLEHHLTTRVLHGLIMSSVSKRMTLSPKDLDGAVSISGSMW